MTQSITLTRPAIKSQLKRFLNNVLRSEDEGYREEVQIFLDPKNISLSDIADLGVKLSREGIHMGNAVNGYNCSLFSNSLNETTIDVFADAWLDLGFELEELLTMQISFEGKHTQIYAYKEKPYRHLTIQNGICQEDDYGLLNGAFLNLEDGDYYINETFLISKAEDDEQ